jgi:tetratricopeptide (TPR) repeat protein
MEDTDPDTFNKYQRYMREETETPTLKSCLSLLRISQWDSELFFRMRHYFINQSPTATRKQRNDLLLDAEKVWAHVYVLDPTKDIAFELGRVMMGIKEYSMAMAFFQRSNETCGEHHITYYNLGICSHYLERYVLAVGFFNETLARSPDYVHAQTWKEKSLAAEAGQGAEGELQQQQQQQAALAAGDGGVVLSEDTFRVGDGEGGPGGDTVTWTHHAA